MLQRANVVTRMGLDPRGERLGRGLDSFDYSIRKASHLDFRQTLKCT